MKRIASLSGGQDSTAMTIKLLEEGVKLDYIVFCDTGNEFDAMYRYLDRLDVYFQDRFGIGITRLKGKYTLESLVFSPFTRGERKGQVRGLPYASSMSFCTRDLKKNISDRFLKNLSDMCTVYLGYVARERGRVHQSDKKYVNYSFPLIKWGWNEPEVTYYLREKSVYNDLYDHFARTGCKFCPKQTLASWKALYAHHREDWEEAKQWEARAKQQDAHIKTFRSDYTLEELEIRFAIELEHERVNPSFDFHWNDEMVSCFCK